MADVRIGTCVKPGRLIDHSHLTPPTDATQWRPYPETDGCDVIASLPEPSPATRGCHPPPEIMPFTFALLHRP
jgi:hypothetical protein